MNILSALQVTIPIFMDALNLDAQICLCDTEKTIGVWYGKTFRLDIAVGTYLDITHPGDDMVLKAIETGEGSSGNLPEFIYGVPTNGILTPIKENGAVVGVLSAAVSIKNNAVVNERAYIVNSGLENAQTGIGEIVSNSELIVKLLGQIRDISEKVEETVSETADVVYGIQRDSQKSNMIALNATIEAARVGEAGKGFSVVAKEMGVLAKNNGDSAKAIKKQIASICEMMQKMTQEFTDILEAATTQLATTEEITSSISEVASEADELAQLCKRNLKL